MVLNSDIYIFDKLNVAAANVQHLNPKKQPFQLFHSLLTLNTDLITRSVEILVLFFMATFSL